MPSSLLVSVDVIEFQTSFYSTLNKAIILVISETPKINYSVRMSNALGTVCKLTSSPLMPWSGVLCDDNTELSKQTFETNELAVYVEEKCDSDAQRRIPQAETLGMSGENGPLERIAAAVR
jgi:hypothetical protein